MTPAAPFAFCSAMEQITPRTIHETGAQLMIWCGKCRSGKLTPTNTPAWRMVWDHDIAELWVKPGFRCACGGLAETLTVSVFPPKHGKLMDMLTLRRLPG